MGALGSKSTNILSIKALHIPNTTSDQLSEEGENRVNFGADTISIVNNFLPKWSEENAYGKMDPMVFYSSTTRKIDVKFQTIANESDASNYSAKKLSTRIEKLTRFLYPRYSPGFSGGEATVNLTSNSAIAAPPLFKITFFKEGRGNNSGNNYTMFSSFTGYFTSITIDPGSSAISMQGGGYLTPKVDGNHLVERGWSVNFSFGILHDVPPGWNGTDWSGYRLFPYSSNSKAPAPAGPPVADANTTINQNNISTKTA